MVYNASTKKVVTIDGREEAPARFHPNVAPQCRQHPHHTTPPSPAIRCSPAAVDFVVGRR